MNRLKCESETPVHMTIKDMEWEIYFPCQMGCCDAGVVAYGHGVEIDERLPKGTVWFDADAIAYIGAWMDKNGVVGYGCYTCEDEGRVDAGGGYDRECPDCRERAMEEAAERYIQEKRGN